MIPPRMIPPRKNRVELKPEVQADEPSPAELRNILKAHGWKEDDPEPDQTPIELKEGEVKSISDLLSEDGEAEEFELPEGVRPAVAAEKERVRNLAGGAFGNEESDLPAKHDPWSRVVHELGKVTVDSHELEEYTRALLHDQRFELMIPILLGSTPLNIVVRSLYVSEREVMACAVSAVADKYPIQTLRNAALVADYWLKIAVLVQVVSINGVSFDSFDARPEPGVLPEKSDKVAKLAEMARLQFGEMHQAKLKALIRALHTFETKQQILEDAYYNRDFQPPADAY